MGTRAASLLGSSSRAPATFRGGRAARLVARLALEPGLVTVPHMVAAIAELAA